MPFKPSEFHTQVPLPKAPVSATPGQAVADGNPASPRVMKIEGTFTPSVQGFQFQDIHRGPGNYQAIKSKYGVLAATDADRSARDRKDSRFNLSSLVRNPLSVEQEENRAIEERVQNRVAEIAAAARTEAAQEGYRQGLKNGYEEAFGQFQREGAGRLSQLEALIAELEASKDAVYRGNEQFLMDLVFRIARMVVLRELTTDREYLTRLTSSLVERIGVRENIRIQIHPEELTTIAMLKEGLERTFGALKNLNIEPSKRVKLGGCMIETELGAIDATVSTQLKGIHDAIFGEGMAAEGGRRDPGQAESSSSSESSGGL